MKSLLTVTAVFEMATGIALIGMPSVVLPLLLGQSFDGPGLPVVCGITGAAMISLALASWFYRNSGSNANPIVKALLFYNTAASLILGYGGLVVGLSGIGLWPAVLLHIGLGVWCAVRLNKAS